MDIYLGRKQKPEFILGLGEEVVLQLTKDLEQSFCTVYFDNFFNSPKLIAKLFQKGIYGIGTVRANRKQMPKMIDDKQMKSRNCEFFFQVIQWLANGWIIGQCCFYHLLLKEWMTYYQFRDEERVQRPNLWFLVLRLSSFTIVAWVELILWTAAYRLYQKPSVRFYFRIFFDLMDIAWVSSYLIYNVKHPNKLSLLDYKIVVAKNLIQYHQGQKRALPMSRPANRKNQPKLIDNDGGRLPNYQTMRKRCMYCVMKGKENRIFVICLACYVALCLVMERNCFKKEEYI